MSLSSYHSARRPAERRSSDGENQNTYFHDAYMGSSTLSGAMGEPSRNSRSPASSHSGSGYGPTQNTDMAWTSSQLQPNMMIPSGAPAYPGVSGLFSHNDLGMGDFPSPARRETPPSPYALASGMMAFPGTGPLNPYAPSTAASSPPHDARSDADTIRALQRRVRELEQECHRTKAALAMGGPASGLPTAPASAHFQAQWRARTDARRRIFCSLNRAGNALCSWHDSRRERRMFPPRNAPPGFLNCGCSYEEALFEESLARHGVGSYHPGENVRMDPALRNPLLKLLVQRYGYKDGDFDHDPLTESWNPGEDPAMWEQKAQAGSLLRRRNEGA